MQDKSTTQIAFRLNGKDISFKTSMNREDSERIRNKFASNFPKVAQMVEQSPKKYYGDFGALLMTAVEIIEFEVGRYNDTDKHLGELENDLKRIAPEYAEKFENERRKLEEDFDIAAKRAQEERDSQIKLLTEDFERKESDYKDRLTDLGRKLSETETAFEKLKQDNALTNTDMSKAREAHAELKSKSDNLQRELVGAKTEADSTAAALKLLQENVEKKIEDEKTKLADELNTRHLRERSDLTKEVAELTGRISAVTSENAALNTARAALLSEQQNFIAQQNTKYTDLLNKLTGEKAAFVEKTESDIALDRERFAKELAEKQVTVEIAIQKTNE
ncbi:MAG: hypothetical protein LBN42_02045, partial [Oscillospiraceae bacterium]|nr:hypothetical protein [Oscillospiraceae bacterium]